jgi:hypothetical protein
LILLEIFRAPDLLFHLIMMNFKYLLMLGLTLSFHFTMATRAAWAIQPEDSLPAEALPNGSELSITTSQEITALALTRGRFETFKGTPLKFCKIEMSTLSATQNRVEPAPFHKNPLLLANSFTLHAHDVLTSLTQFDADPSTAIAGSKVRLDLSNGESSMIIYCEKAGPLPLTVGEVKSLLGFVQFDIPGEVLALSKLQQIRETLPSSAAPAGSQVSASPSKSANTADQKPANETAPTIAVPLK